MATQSLFPAELLLRRIGVFTYPGVEILDIGGPIEVFSFANLMLMQQGITQKPVYTIDIIAEKPGVITTLSGLQIIANCAYSEICEELDTLFIPGGYIPGGFFNGRDIGDPGIFKNPRLKNWLCAMATQVKRLAAVCTGSFALAECGLLNGRRATTHWDFCNRLRQDYPEVMVEPDQIFIKEGNIFTSGGITSGIDLALALLEDDWGHQIALSVARYMVVFFKRPGGQSQFSNYLTAEAVKRSDIRNLQAWIVTHPDADLRIEVLAARMCMSSRNFARLFLAETGMTPAKYVEMARIDAARHYLETTDLSIEYIAEKSGFYDPERMRRSFMRQLGVNPKSYRGRFASHYATAVS